jgi:hypothetical protein
MFPARAVVASDSRCGVVGVLGVGRKAPAGDGRNGVPQVQCCPYTKALLRQPESSRRKKTQVSPSVSKARNRTTGRFVFRELHAIVVPPLPITPHTYPPPLQVLIGALRSGRREGPYLNL